MTLRHHLRRFGALAAMTAAGLALQPALAQPAGMPASLRIMVGFAPGGGTDVVARIYADALREQIKIPVVVENKPGAGGAIAAQTAVAAPATQPTLLFAIDHQTAILQHIMKNPGFDAERDLVPLGRIVTYEVCFAVNAQVAAKTLNDYAAGAKADASLGSVAVPAPGSNAQFISHVVGQHYGLKLVPVPYRGAAPAMSDLAGGQIKAAVMPCDAFVNFVQAGTVRVLAVVGDKRSTRWPDVPAMQELGIRIPSSNNFLGAYATRNTDPKLVAMLVTATRELYSKPAFVDKVNATGQFANYASPEDLARFSKEASAFWGAQVKSSGFAAE